jgi:hypothetical protein
MAPADAGIMTLDDALAEALRSIPGVADAEVDEGDGPNGVRVRLSPGADPAEVAVAVREVLADRGLRGRLAPAPRHVEPDQPPPPPASDRTATVIPGPGWIGQPVSDEPVQEELPMGAGRGPEDRRGAEEHPGPGETPGHDQHPVSAEQGGPGERAVSVEPPSGGATTLRSAGTGLARVMVEEGRDTLSVTAEARDGTRATRSARTSPEGFHQAVVGAVAALLDPGSPAPRVVTVRDDVVAEGRIITVVLERADGAAMVGSSMVGAERAFALARAAWAALTDAP